MTTAPNAKATGEHIVLNGVRYLLARDGRTKARAWRVDPAVDARASRTQPDAQYGQLPPEVRVPALIQSGHAGYGEAHTRPERPNTYHYTVNADCSVPEVFLRAPKVTALNLSQGGTPTGLFEYRGRVFVLAGQYIYAVTAADVVTLDKDLGNGITASRQAAVWQDKAYVGIGTGGAFWQRDSNGTWTQQSTGGAVQAHGFVPIEDDLWRAATTGSVSVCAALTDPMQAANWSTPINVGDTGTHITSLATVGFKLYVGKTDGLYNVDQQAYTPNVMPQFRATVDSRNCQDMQATGPLLLIPHVRGLLAYNDATAEVLSIQPGYTQNHVSPMRGQVRAVAIDGPWIYCAAVNTDGDSVIFKGRMRAEGEPGTGAMVWHPVLHFPGATVETLLVSGIAASPRLYIGLARGYTGSVAYITLPRNAEANPLYDELVTLGTEGHFYFSAIDFGSPGSLKVVSRVDIVAENLSEDDYLDVLMRVDGGTWRGLGRVTANGGQALTESALAGEEFEIQIQSVANAAVPAPSAGRLKKVIIEGTERPPVVDIHSLTVRASDGLIDGYGTQVQANRRTIIGTLRALARANTPVYFQDPDGELHYGLVLPGITYSELHQQDDRPVEFLIGFRFQTLRTFGTVGRYGSATYGRDVYGARQIRTTTYGTGVYGDADYGGG